MAGMHSIPSSANGTLHETNLTDVKMEPNGTAKGATPPMPAPVPAPAPVPTSTPVLPDNMNGMVPLRAIIHRMTNEAFSDLSNLSEVLPSMSDQQKKLHILEYTLSKREQFIKLLVLTKWAKSAQKFQQCQNIVGFLQNENMLMQRAVGGLFETYNTFGRARVRNFDIPTAIDVLTTGTYQRLPSRIKQAYIQDDKPTGTEIAATLEKLDDVIRMRMLCDELVPPAMKYTIGKGKAKFLVPNEFEVTLTVSGPGAPQEIPWRIVGLKILVKPVGGSFQGLETSLNEGQLRAIVAFAQKELDSSVLQGNPPHAAVSSIEHRTVPANQALLRLYDYLHMLSLHLLIELVCTQANNLLRSGWTDRLRVEVNQARSVVRLVYWNNGFVPQPVPPQPSAPVVKRRTSTPLITSPNALGRDAGAAAGQQEHYLEIKIEEYRGPTTQIPEGLAGALVDSKLLGYPKASIKVVWSQVVKGIVQENNTRAVLELDPSSLNIETLLLKAVNMHAGQVIQGFHDRLRSHIENMATRAENMDGAHFSKDDVKLETIDMGEQHPAGAATVSSGPQALLVRLKADRWIRIRIDVRTGRVVVREVGKTGEGDDPVITAFQIRLNENASSIVDALVSLRFSMAMVELEAMSISLGLQPYRRIALAMQDLLRFGSGIQQILFLQYPQHARHYLVIGVMEQKFCTWLIEVAPTDKEVGGIWLTLKSISPVYWQGLKRTRKDTDENSASKELLKKRKSVQFDLEGDVSQEPQNVDGMTIDHDVLLKLEANCRARICLNEVEAQLRAHGIRYRQLRIGKKKDGSPMGDGRPAQSTMANRIPMLCLESSSISSGTTDGLFQSVGAKLIGWWSSQPETCRFVVQAMLMPAIIPATVESGRLDSCVYYNAKIGMLSFSYTTRGEFIQQFKNDWETIVRMLKIICQLHAPTLSNPHIRLRACHLHYVQLEYYGRYTITLKWVPASNTEKRSTMGVVAPIAPRFRQGQYEVSLSEMEPRKGCCLNPHRRMKSFLQDMFNRESDLHSLMNIILQTCSVLEVLDQLEDSVKEDSMGMKMLSVVPRSAHHVRVIYGSKYALDIKAYNRTHLSMFDASFPTESYSASLPPPPAPSVAPGLAQAGRIIPPTTKGHLHYGPIPNLQTAISSIDVDKEDDEYNVLRSQITPGSAEGGDTMFVATTPAVSNIQPPANTSQSALTTEPRFTRRDPQDEVYQIMPLQNGLVCSRNASGRVLYRIAKHIETLL
ncbi:mediator complex subunit [Mortierella alpina]|nr:mediator complex subunit [Mortierella alpina]